MPEHSKHRRGCDCLNRTPSYTPGAINIDNECEYCDDGYSGAPCAFNALFECDYWTTAGERIAIPCLTLRKDCPTGCTYTSRWDYVNGVDTPVLQPAGCIVRDDAASCYLCPNVRCFELQIGTLEMPQYSGGLPANNPVELSLNTQSGECAYRGVGSYTCYPFGSPVPGNCFGFEAIFQLAANGTATLTMRYFITAFGAAFGEQQTITFDLGYIDCAGGYFYATYGSAVVSGSIFPKVGTCTEGTGSIDGWEGGCTWISQPCYGCWTKWTLQVTSTTTATLTLVTRQGYTAVYTATNFRCNGRSTFQMQYQDPETIGIPKCLCVAGIDAPVNVGDCAPSFCDDGATTRNWVHNDGYVCYTLAIPAGTYNYSRGTSLPPTVGNGDSLGRCNYFWREFTYTADSSCSQWAPGGTGLIGVLILAKQAGGPGDCFPTGPVNDRAVEYQFWCFDYDLNDWVLQGTQCGEYYCCDPSVAPIEFSADCCCPDIPTVDECGCTGIPTVLTVSDGTNSFDLTYSGGTWLVTPGVGTTFAGCTFGSGAGRSIALQCFGGSTWYFAVDDGNGGLPITCAPTGMCSPFALSCSITGCDANTYTIDITI